MVRGVARRPRGQRPRGGFRRELHHEHRGLAQVRHRRLRRISGLAATDGPRGDERAVQRGPRRGGGYGGLEERPARRLGHLGGAALRAARGGPRLGARQRRRGGVLRRRRRPGAEKRGAGLPAGEAGGRGAARGAARRPGHAGGRGRRARGVRAAARRAAPPDLGPLAEARPGRGGRRREPRARRHPRGYFTILYYTLYTIYYI